MTIWFTSDFHFCHNKEFLYSPRGFTNVFDMNEAIINNWNEVVQPDDIVYVLGDLALNDDATALKCIKRLKGTLNVILGNHDTESRIDNYCDCYNINSVKFADRVKFNKYSFFLCHYPTITSNFDEKALRQKTINLCGHSHTKNRYQDMDKGLIYHVELDAHDNRPVSIDEIIEDINKVYYGQLNN